MLRLIKPKRQKYVHIINETWSASEKRLKSMCNRDMGEGEPMSIEQFRADYTEQGLCYRCREIENYSCLSGGGEYAAFRALQSSGAYIYPWNSRAKKMLLATDMIFMKVVSYEDDHTGESRSLEVFVPTPRGRSYLEYAQKHSIGFDPNGVSHYCDLNKGQSDKYECRCQRGREEVLLVDDKGRSIASLFLDEKIELFERNKDVLPTCLTCVAESLEYD